MLAAAFVASCTVVLAIQQQVAAAEVPESAWIDDPACIENILPANDDGSTATRVPLGFSIEFGDVTADQVWINNNGNITFDQRLGTYTPSNLAQVRTPIIAPFWADVDTNRVGSDPVRYGWGETVIDGRKAFCVNWFDVNYYGAQNGDRLNQFQLLLVDREGSDFDVLFNYTQITWESGIASGGSNGLGGTSARAGFYSGREWYEIPGSGVNGAFLDDGTAPLRDRVRAVDTEYNPSGDITGRFEYKFRDGEFLDPGAPNLKRPWEPREARVGSVHRETQSTGSNRGATDALVVSGPNLGARPSCAEGFSLCYLNYRGDGGVGIDLIQVWSDDNDNSAWDFPESRSFQIVNWRSAPSQVALGDSYSSGEGINGSSDAGYLPGYDGLPACHRSAQAWPAQLELFGNGPAITYQYPSTEIYNDDITFSFLACTSARTYNVIRDRLLLQDLPSGGLSAKEFDEGVGPNPSIREPNLRQGLNLEQIDGVTGGVDLVTMSIGGNDAQWTELLTECFFNNANNCFDTEVTFPGTSTPLTDWADARLDLVTERIEATLLDIKAAAPGATIVLAGYPHIAPATETERSCGKFNPRVLGANKLSPDELIYVRNLQIIFDSKLANAAESAGVHFVSVQDAFEGHEICGEEGEWINALVIDVLKAKIGAPASFHPKAQGHIAYAHAIEDYFDELVSSGWPLTDAGLPENPGGSISPEEEVLGFAQDFRDVASGLDSVSSSLLLASGTPGPVQALASAPAALGVASSDAAISEPLPTEGEFVDVILTSPLTSACPSPAGTVVSRGGALQIAASGFAPGTPVAVNLQSINDASDTVYDLGVLPANATGSVDGTVDIPVDVATGGVATISLLGTTPGGASGFGRATLAIGDTAAPCITDDIATTMLNNAVTIDVLGNDDPNGSSFAPETLSVDMPPVGTADVDPAGRITVTPPLNYVGDIAVEYRICRIDAVCAAGDVIVRVDPRCTMIGTAQNDELIGTDGDDIICGLGGNDVINGGAGNDTIIGGTGNDLISGGSGQDLLIGGPGTDNFEADNADTMDTDPGEEVLQNPTEPPLVYTDATLTPVDTNNDGVPDSARVGLTVRSNDPRTVRSDVAIAAPDGVNTYTASTTSSVGAQTSTIVVNVPGNFIRAYGPGTYTLTIATITAVDEPGVSAALTAPVTATMPSFGAFKPNLSPILECVTFNTDNTFTARFGYENREGFAYSVPVGTNNRLNGTTIAATGPVTRFEVPNLVPGRPGRTPFGQGVFTVAFTAPNNIVWKLGARTATASSNSTRCAT